MMIASRIAPVVIRTPGFAKTGSRLPASTHPIGALPTDGGTCIRGLVRLGSHPRYATRLDDRAVESNSARGRSYKCRGSGSRATMPVIRPPALAGSTAFDVISILRKKRMYMTDYEVQVEAESGGTADRCVRESALALVLTGVDIERKAVEDATRLSEEEYCSLGAVIHKSAEFDTTFEIRGVAVEKGYHSHSVAQGAVRWQKRGTLDADLH